MKKGFLEKFLGVTIILPILVIGTATMYAPAVRRYIRKWIESVIADVDPQDLEERKNLKELLKHQ